MMRPKNQALWLAVAVILLVPLMAATVLAAPPNRTTAIVVEGQELHFRLRPVFDGDEALVPFRTVFRALGATVKWNGANRTAVSEWEGSTIRFPMQQKWAQVDGQRHTLPVASRVITGSSFVPVSFLEEVLGLYVRWDSDRLVIEHRTGQDLEHKVVVDLENGRVGLRVHNPNRRSATVTLPSSQTHDFIIRSGNEKVWQASQGQAYLTVIQTLTFRAGEYRTFWSELPELNPGDYVVEGYFPNASRPVARERLTVESQLPATLRYSVVVDQNSGRVGLIVRNTGREQVSVTVPSSKTHDFVIKSQDEVIWRASEGKAYLPQVTPITFAPNQSRVYWNELPELGRGDYVVEAYFGNHPRPLARSSFQVTAPENSLRYWLLHDEEAGRLGLMVFNYGDETAVVTFPTSQTHDFILRHNGVKVWQASEGQAYLPVVSQERIGARAYEVYWTDLPQLPGGTYQAEAYFLGDGSESRVAAATITLPQMLRDPLEYRLSFQASGLLGGGPRLALEVRNEGKEDLSLASRYGYRLVVKDATGNVVSGVGFSRSVGTFAVGAQRYHYSYLHSLPRGTYTAEVQSNLTGTYRTVSTQRFMMP